MMQFSSGSFRSFTFLLSLLACTPAPSSTEPLGSRYVGCYIDTGTNRVLSVWANGVNNQVSSMTNELCAHECVGYNYFGTEYSTYCFCSDQIADGVELAPTSSTCNSACGGDGNEFCGGFWLIDVYTLSSTAAVKTSNAYATAIATAVATAVATADSASQTTDSSLSPAEKGTIAGSVFGGVSVLIAIIRLCIPLSRH